MRSHLRSIAKRKGSDFLLREEGIVGSRSAFVAAAFVGATVFGDVFTCLARNQPPEVVPWASRSQ